MTFLKVANEGYPFIIGSFLLTVVTSIFLMWKLKSGNYNFLFYFLLLVLCFFFITTLFGIYFFRDPDRTIPDQEGLFVSPADGKVILIRETHEPTYLNSPSREISIFMSPLDVHVNRAPCDGKVTFVKHLRGKFIAAYKDESSLKNENVVIILENKNGKVLVRQVAGFIARRVVCKVKVGDYLKRGDRYGMIKFGSRLDVYLPLYTKIEVKVGDKVKAGETILAKIIT